MYSTLIKMDLSCLQLSGIVKLMNTIHLTENSTTNNRKFLNELIFPISHTTNQLSIDFIK